MQLDYELEYGREPYPDWRSIVARSTKKKRKKGKKREIIPRDEYDEGVIAKNDVPPMQEHIAVRLDNFIVFFGGETTGVNDIPLSVIHTYNLDSERWKKYEIPDSENIPPIAVSTCAAAVTPSDIYMFAGMAKPFPPCEDSDWLPTNALWKLSAIGQNKYTWQEITFEGKGYIPSQRYGATAWEYDRKFWTFAGAGLYPHHYKRAYGEWKHGGFLFIRGVKKIKTHFCNQLNCYDPNTNTWKNIRCYGTVPTPRIWAEAHELNILSGCMEDREDINLMMSLLELFTRSIWKV